MNPIPLSRGRRRRSRLGTLVELTGALARGGRWWLVPFVGVMGLTAVLMMVVQVIEYVAPFVYTLF
jgi:hypothetical protein